MNKILVVDDEESIRDVVKKYLEKLNYSVDLAHSVDQAIEFIDNRSYSIVITDIMMPEKSGQELVHFLKKHDPKIEIILMTGFPSLDSAIDAVKSDVYDYIVKPDYSRLTQSVRNIFEKLRLLHEKEDYQQKLENNFKELLKLHRAKDLLSRIILENIRIPLFSLRMNLEALEHGLAGSLMADQLNLVKTCKQNCRMSFEVTEKFMDIDQLEKDIINSKKEQVDLDSLLFNAMDSFVKDEDVERELFKVSYPDKNFSFTGDSELLTKIFKNIFRYIMNNITNDDDKISVCLEKLDNISNIIMIRFSCRALNIPMKYQIETLDLYGQEELLEKGVQIQLNLELPFCKLAVEMHGGKFFVESDEMFGDSIVIELKSDF